MYKMDIKCRFFLQIHNNFLQTVPEYTVASI